MKVSLDLLRVIQRADKFTQMVPWLDKDVTLVLVLTHSKEICLLNYANMAEVVTTFSLMRGCGPAQIGSKLLCVTRCLRQLLMSVSSVHVCFAIKGRAAVFGRHLDDANTNTHEC